LDVSTPDSACDVVLGPWVQAHMKYFFF